MFFERPSVDRSGFSQLGKTGPDYTLSGSTLGSRLSALGSRLTAHGSRLSALSSRLSALGSRLSALGSQPWPGRLAVRFGPARQYSRGPPLPLGVSGFVAARFGPALSPQSRPVRSGAGCWRDGAASPAGPCGAAELGTAQHGTARHGTARLAGVRCSVRHSAVLHECGVGRRCVG